MSEVRTGRLERSRTTSLSALSRQREQSSSEIFASLQSESRGSLHKMTGEIGMYCHQATEAKYLHNDIDRRLARRGLVSLFVLIDHEKPVTSGRPEKIEFDSDKVDRALIYEKP